MAKAALVLVGLAAAAGVALVVSKSKAAEPLPPTNPNPTPPTGPIPAGNTPPPANGTPGAGSAGPPIQDPNLINLLPPALQDIQLSGQEELEYIGPNTFGGRIFNEWAVHHSLNDMTVNIWVAIDNPDDWISAFWHVDPAGSTPAAHWIVYKVTDGPNAQWLKDNILGPGAS